MNNQILAQLTDYQMGMMIQGCLYNHVAYGYYHKDVKLMYVCGSYGRTNLEKANIKSLPTSDKLSVLLDLLGDK